MLNDYYSDSIGMMIMRMREEQGLVSRDCVLWDLLTKDDVTL